MGLTKSFAFYNQGLVRRVVDDGRRHNEILDILSFGDRSSKRKLEPIVDSLTEE